MVAHCWRFDEEALWLKQQLDEGLIGSVVRSKGCGVHVNWGPSGWFTQAKYAGGGALVDMGIHAIDMARFLLGDPQPVSVYADIRTRYGDYDVDDTGTIWSSSGTPASTSTIESGWWQPQADGPEASTRSLRHAGLRQPVSDLSDHTQSALNKLSSASSRAFQLRAIRTARRPCTTPSLPILSTASPRIEHLSPAASKAGSI